MVFQNFRNGSDKFQRIGVALLEAFKPFLILLTSIRERCREIYNYEKPAEVKNHNPKQIHSKKMITAEEKDELKNWCAEAALGVGLNEAAIQAQQLELIKSIRNK